MRSPADSGYKALLLAALFVPAGFIAFKLTVLGYSLAALVPAVSFRVDLSMQVDGHGEDVTLATYLPQTDSRQAVEEEQHAPGPFAFAVAAEGPNRLATWSARGVSGRHSVVYTYSVQAFVLVFPECLLMVVGLNLWLGRWTGIRVLEYLRFRNLLRAVP